jgi:hypothetical protein
MTDGDLQFGVYDFFVLRMFYSPPLFLRWQLEFLYEFAGRLFCNVLLPGVALPLADVNGSGFNDLIKLYNFGDMSMWMIMTSTFSRRRLESSGQLVLLVFVWRTSLLLDGERLLAFLSAYFIVQLLSLRDFCPLSCLLPGEYVLRDEPSLSLSSGCFRNRLLSCWLLCLNASLREKVVNLFDIPSLGL